MRQLPLVHFTGMNHVVDRGFFSHFYRFDPVIADIFLLRKPLRQTPYRRNFENGDYRASRRGSAFSAPSNQLSCHDRPADDYLTLLDALRNGNEPKNRLSCIWLDAVTTEPRRRLPLAPMICSCVIWLANPNGGAGFERAAAAGKKHVWR